jgi:hypothetical protein
MTTEERRTLVFDRLEAVAHDVDALLLGHATRGTWTLGQILHHLTTAIELSLDPGSRALQVDDRRASVLKRRFFSVGRFPDGLDAPHPILASPVDADPREQARRLAEAISRLEAATEPLAAHPVLGPLSKPEWETFHRIHCAHHLGFVVPTALDRGTGFSR